MNELTNEDNLRLKQMLEIATAADSSVAGRGDEEPLDADSASMREAWLAFGQLIRAADAAMPELRMAEPGLTTPIARPKPRGSRLPALLAATAAAVLVAVTFGWWIGRDGTHHADRQAGVGGDSQAALHPTPHSSGDVPAVAKGLVVQKQSASTVAQAANATDKKANSGAAKSSTWDDPLETQIASVSQEVSDVEQNWQHRVDDADVVQYRIDEVSASLQNDKL